MGSLSIHLAQQLSSRSFSRTEMPLGVHALRGCPSGSDALGKARIQEETGPVWVGYQRPPCWCWLLIDLHKDRVVNGNNNIACVYSLR